MNKITCFSLVSQKVEKSTNAYGKGWAINREAYDELKTFCDYIDELSSEFSSDSIDVYIDNNKRIIIDILYSYMVIRNGNHLFYDLISKSISTNIRYKNEDEMIIGFVLPTVWKKVG